ncbi:MAG: hypothetical protein AAF821_06480 [Cyanobacteria bacterium P01_D01_bin.156]
MISQIASTIATTHTRESSVTPETTLNMTTPDNAPKTLDLLVPWDIPLEYSLNDTEKQKIQIILEQLLYALNTKDSSQALAQVEQLLTTLPIPNTKLAQVQSTKTSLSTDDVDDYDQYFGINHVQTDETSLCLVRGLLTNCHRFIALCHQNSQLSSKHVEQQKQGFISYIHLLARVFYLEALS